MQIAVTIRLDESTIDALLAAAKRQGMANAVDAIHEAISQFLALQAIHTR